MKSPQRALAVSDFEGRVGEVFPATTSSGARVELTLTRLVVRPEEGPVAPGFSLEFRTRASEPRQQLVQIEHPDAGTHAVFVVPVERDRDDVVFQAVFSFVPAPTGE